MIVFADKWAVNENVRIAIIVGFLGAFTTFSTFEIEVYSLIRDREFMTGFLYLFLSVFVGFIGVALGIELGRRV